MAVKSEMIARETIVEALELAIGTALAGSRETLPRLSPGSHSELTALSLVTAHLGITSIGHRIHALFKADHEARMQELEEMVKAA